MTRWVKDEVRGPTSLGHRLTHHASLPQLWDSVGSQVASILKMASHLQPTCHAMTKQASTPGERKSRPVPQGCRSRPLAWLRRCDLILMFPSIFLSCSQMFSSICSTCSHPFSRICPSFSIIFPNETWWPQLPWLAVPWLIPKVELGEDSGGQSSWGSGYTDDIAPIEPGLSVLIGSIVIIRV